MADTATAENLSATRAVRFTAGGIMKLAWKLARAGSIRETPDAEDYEFMRQWMNVRLDEVAARARIARSVTRLTTTMVSGTASYALSSDVFDVVGVGTYEASGDTYERLVYPMGRDEYMALTYKESPGPPSRYYPEKTSVVTVYPWPVPDAAGTLTLQAARWVQDVTSIEQTVDLERYFVPWLIHGLAHKVAQTNSIDINYCRDLERQADGLFQLALGSAKQRGSSQFVMSHRTGWMR